VASAGVTWVRRAPPHRNSWRSPALVHAPSHWPQARNVVQAPNACHSELRPEAGLVATYSAPVLLQTRRLAARSPALAAPQRRQPL
jgi:hypothetical protein